MRLILASASPRRRELLALFGLPFEAMASQVEERRAPGEPARDYALRLSREKALAVARLIDGAALILASDTVVVDGEAVLEKPASAEEARAMLRQLRGRVHRVYSAITVLKQPEGRLFSEAPGSPVWMRSYSDEEIEAYIASGDPFDKAGAYAIQHPEFRPVQDFSHCFANVMGLPLCHLSRLLHAAGLDFPADIASECQALLTYACPVHQAILAGQEPGL